MTNLTPPNAERLWQQWQQQCQAADPAWGLDEQLAEWHATFSEHDVQRWGPPPVWIPDPLQAKHTRLGRWMAELGFTRVDAFHRWSVEQREKFWEAAVERLGIRWASPPRHTLELGKGPADARWFVGGSFDLVGQCLDHATQRTILRIGQSDGTIDDYTGGQLRHRVDALCAGLRAEGFQAGDALAIVMPLNLDAIVAYLAVIQCGCLVVSIPESFAAPEIATRLRIAQVKGIFTVARFRRAGRDIDLYQRLSAARNLLSGDALPRMLVATAGGEQVEPLAPIDIHWEPEFGLDLVEQESDRVCHFPSDHRINVLFSSGTTGDPKAIPWTQITPFKCAVDGMLLHDLGPEDVVAWPTSLGWMMGPWLLFASWLNGACVAVFDDAPTTAEFVRFIERARVSMLGVIPTLVRHWRAAGLLQHADWSGIRRFSSTGEASQVDDMVYLSVAAGGKPIIEYCGGTEIGGGYIGSTLMEANSPAAFNTVAFGLGLQILDETGHEATEGEAYLVPPSVGLSQELLNRDHYETYYADVPHGMHGELLRRHGDRFRAFESGLFAAGGRVDDTMNLGGIKISSAELERALNRVAEVTETAAVACPASGGGPERLVVFAVLAPEAMQTNPTTLLDKFNRILKQEVNPLFRAAEVIVLDTLPRTASNKVMRRKLRQQLN